jgi:hypothetical protein
MKDLDRELAPLGVTTRHWDTVSAIRIDELNKAIRLAGTSPRGFSDSLDGVTVSARFEPWRIGPDGDGQTITLMLDLGDIEISDAEGTRRFAAAQALVDVRLELLPHDANQNGPVQRLLLVVSLQPLERSDRVATVTDVIIEEPHKLVDQAHIGMVLQNWLNLNLQSFTHVFAAITLYRTVDKAEDFPWLKPTFVAYAFGRNANDPSKSLLGVLCQTGNRSADGLVYQIEQDVLPKDTTVGFAISRRRFLTDMLMPSLPLAFDGLKASQIVLSADDSQLNLSSPATLTAVKHKGKTYHPRLEELKIEVHETELLTTSHTCTQIIPGVSGHCRAHGGFGITLVDAKGGGKSLGMTRTRKMTEDNWQETAKSIVVLEWVLLALAALATIVIGICTFGLGIAAATPVYVALYGGIAGFTLISGAKILAGDDSPPIDLLLAQADTAVSWSAGGPFQPTFAGLDHALVVGGDYPDPPLTAGVDAATDSAQARFQNQFADRMAARRTGASTC